MLGFLSPAEYQCWNAFPFQIQGSWVLLPCEIKLKATLNWAFSLLIVHASLLSLSLYPLMLSEVHSKDIEHSKITYPRTLFFYILTSISPSFSPPSPLLSYLPPSTPPPTPPPFVFRKGQASHRHQPAMTYQAAVILGTSSPMKARGGNPVTERVPKAGNRVRDSSYSHC